MYDKTKTPKAIPFLKPVLLTPPLFWNTRKNITITRRKISPMGDYLEWKKLLKRDTN
jgi:hypothetical protein